MSKFFKGVGIFFVGAIVGAIIVFFIKPKSPVIDEKDIPKKLTPAVVVPDKIVSEEVYLESLANSKQLQEEINDLENAIVYLKEKVKTVKKIEEQPKNEQPKDTTILGIKIKMKASFFEARWTLNEDGDMLIPMIKPYNNDWYVKVDTKVLSFTSAKQEEIIPMVRWKKHYQDFREPKIAQQMYNRGAVGMIKGVAGTAALFSGDKYVAGTGIFIIVDEVMKFGMVDFLYNLIN